MKKHSLIFVLLILIAALFYPLKIQHLYAGSDQVKPTLKEIKFISITPEHEQITFLLDGSPTVRIFTFNGDRPRIILDFPQTVPAMMIANTVKTNGNLVEQIRMGIHRGDKAKTRIVLDLALDMEIAYKQTLDQEKNLLIISVYKAGTQPEPPQVAAELSEHEVKVKEIIDPKTEEIESATSPVLHSIHFDNSTVATGEMVRFQLNGFYPPKVSTIESGTPRVIFDFKNTILANPVADIIKTDGKFIKSIRISKHNNPDKIRVVIELMPDNSYNLEQMFFKQDKTFVITVNAIDIRHSP